MAKRINLFHKLMLFYSNLTIELYSLAEESLIVVEIRLRKNRKTTGD